MASIERAAITRFKVIEAGENAAKLWNSIANSHPNPVNRWNTSHRERAGFLREYLDALEQVCSDPQLIPLNPNGKAPSIAGTCSLDSKQGKEFQHGREDAIAAIERGTSGFALYAGRADHGTEDLVFADHDDLSAFPLNTLPETLTAVSGSGEGYHETFLNAGGVGNAKSDGGEIRASGWYVVVPGSIHPSGGIYHLEETRQIAEIEPDEIPERLHPSRDSYDGADIEFSRESTGDSFTNDVGMSLDEIREYDKELNRLLDTQPRPRGDTSDDSKLDAGLVRRLRFHHFEPTEITAIWRQYRGRQKLERDDYIRRTIQFVGTHNDRCQYDGTEKSIILPEIQSAPEDAGLRDDNSSDGTALTLNEARKRCQRIIESALLNGSYTLIHALPAMGKSSGIIRGAANTNIPVSVFTARHELYGQYIGWCEEHGLTSYRLPSFHEDCPTAGGDHGEDWREDVLELYDNGVMAGEIHKYSEQYFDKKLPCDDGQECPYKLGWDFECDQYDVLVGHYQHAHNPDLTAGRFAVFDEFPADSYILEFGGGTLSSAVAAYASEHDDLPFDDFTELLEIRNTVKAQEARDWFDVEDLERDGRHVLNNNSASANAYVPLLTYAVLDGENLGNGWEHTDFDSESGLGNHRTAARKRDSGELHLVLSPNLQEARGVIALDGTPTPELWQLAVDNRLNHHQVLSDEEQADYLTDALDFSIVQTTDATKTYSSGTYVKPQEDGLLFDEVARRENKEPALISTKKAINQYKKNGVLKSIGKHQYYGNLKGSNRFEKEHLGIVTGSQHYGDGYVQMWGALNGEAIERIGNGKGMDLDYGEFGNKVLSQMREHEVLQAVLRFGRNSHPTSVYVHTAALPEWVPIEAKGDIDTWSKGTQEVIEVLERNAPGRWRTSEVSQHVSISTRQVRTNLNKLAEVGCINKISEGRGTTYIVSDEEIDRLAQINFRAS